MTLEDILEQSKSGDVKGAIKALAEFVDKQDNDSLASFKEVLSGIQETNKELISAMESLSATVQKLVDKPDVEYPESPEIQRVTMDCPEWYVPPSEPSNDWIPNFLNSIRYDGDKTRAILQKILEKESEETIKEIKEEPKTVNSAAVRSRRTTQWVKASTVLGNIIGAIDGVNTKFYLPSAVIKNSETVLLNGATPLSLGTDYTLTGNQINFVIAPPVSSVMEVKYQTK